MRTNIHTYIHTYHFIYIVDYHQYPVLCRGKNSFVIHIRLNIIFQALINIDYMIQ